MADHVDVLYELANGAQVHMRASESTGLSTGSQTWIFGSEGTIHVDRRQNVFFSSITRFRSGLLCNSFQAVASPTMPPPTIVTFARTLASY